MIDKLNLKASLVIRENDYSSEYQMIGCMSVQDISHTSTRSDASEVNHNNERISHFRVADRTTVLFEGSFRALVCFFFWETKDNSKITKFARFQALLSISPIGGVII
jgi:hypothetical protein